MERRAVIKSLGFVSLHTLYPSVLATFLSGCQSGDALKKRRAFFTAEEQELVKELIDIILPRTGTKSASEVHVHHFLDEVFAVCLDHDQKEVIKEGLSALGNSWEKEPDHTKVVRTLDDKAFGGDEAASWFKTVKQLVLIGFFTSQEGTTKAGDYQKFPDKYTGELPIGENTLAHSKTSVTFDF